MIWELVQAPDPLAGTGKGLAEWWGDAAMCFTFPTKSLLASGFFFLSFLTAMPGRMLKDSLNWLNQNQLSPDSSESCF